MFFPQFPAFPNNHSPSNWVVLRSQILRYSPNPSLAGGSLISCAYRISRSMKPLVTTRSRSWRFVWFAHFWGEVVVLPGNSQVVEYFFLFVCILLLPLCDQLVPPPRPCGISCFGPHPAATGRCIQQPVSGDRLMAAALGPWANWPHQKTWHLQHCCGSARVEAASKSLVMANGCKGFD